MPTADRLLDLLALFTSRAQWSADELAERLVVTERTIRRDVARLREIGYPIEATTGLHGGYRLGAGGKLPPLLLDDDEAVAVGVALAAIAGAPAGASADASDVAGASVSALAKLDRVLPPRLRERVTALRDTTVGLGRPGVPLVDTGALVTIAIACGRPERLRFEYLDGVGRSTDRHVEPFRLVVTHRQWYLVAFDRSRDAWRTFRVDRMSSVRLTGIVFVHGPVPDAATFVAEGMAVGAHSLHSRVRFPQPAARVRQWLDPMVGLIDEEDERGTVVIIGGDVDWIARYLAGLEEPFEVIEPPELIEELRAHARRLLREHRRPADRDPPAGDGGAQTEAGSAI